MGLVRWRWLVSGLCAALLCAPALTAYFPFCQLVPCARAAEAQKKDEKDKQQDAKKKPQVEDTKVDDKDAEELPLIDLAAGDPAATTAENVAEDLGGGVTATGKAGAKRDGKSGAAKELPFDSARFLLKDRQEGLSLDAIADPESFTPFTKPNAKPAKSHAAVKQNAVKPAAASHAKQPAPKKNASAPSKPVNKGTPPRIQLPEKEPAAPVPERAAVEAFIPDNNATTDVWAAGNVGPQQPPVNGSSPSLKQYFSSDELSADTSGSTAVESPATGAITTESATDTKSDLYAGVIQTQRAASSVKLPDSPSIGEALNNSDDQTIGSNLPAFNPWRSGSMVLLCLAMAFAAMWAAGKFKGSLPGGNKRSLNVIESITVAPGRQISIVEMHGEALVLGITPQSINLLDKLPLERFSMDYSSTVETIINREASALPGEWAKRPAFVTGTKPPPLPPAPAYRSIVPPPRERISVGELRRSRGLSTGTGAPPPVRAMAYTSRGVAYTPPVSATGTGDRVSKDELISRLRSQLGKLEG